MRRGRTWPWIRMRPFLGRLSEPVWSGHLASWADFITTTPELEFSVHTGADPFHSGRAFALIRARQPTRRCSSCTQRGEPGPSHRHRSAHAREVALVLLVQVAGNLKLQQNRGWYDGRPVAADLTPSKLFSAIPFAS
jgi:hypothetical protein